MRKTDPGKWYREINTLTGNSSGSSLQAPSAEDLSTLAEPLQEVFTSVWSNLTSTVSEVLNSGLRDVPYQLPSIGQVKSNLKRLNPKKATRNDGIPAWLLKKHHEELTEVVHDIISASIEQRTYPDMYKHALVSPVPKVSNPTCINSNYRQISVLPQMAKILERIQLLINGKNLGILPNQQAFIKDR